MWQDAHPEVPYEGIEERAFGVGIDLGGGHRVVHLNPYFRRVLPEVYHTIYRIADEATRVAGWDWNFLQKEHGGEESRFVEFIHQP